MAIVSVGVQTLFFADVMGRETRDMRRTYNFPSSTIDVYLNSFAHEKVTARQHILCFSACRFSKIVRARSDARRTALREVLAFGMGEMGCGLVHRAWY